MEPLDKVVPPHNGCRERTVQTFERLSVLTNPFPRTMEL